MRLLRAALIVSLALVVLMALEWSLLNRAGQLLDDVEADRAAWTARGQLVFSTAQPPVRESGSD